MSPAATFSALLRGPPPRARSVVLAAAARAHSTAGGGRARGGLPRFHSPTLPSSKGEVVRIQGDEFWHMTRVLRLGINDRVELFDGAGGLVEGSIQKVDKGGSDVELLEDAKLIAPHGIQWHVFAAFGQRMHGMLLNPPIQIPDLQSVVSQSKLAFLASAESRPLLSTLPKTCNEESGLLIVGPEGDFTEEEVNILKAAGAVPVGLGPCRLRVETATISLLSALMLWSDAHRQEALNCS